MPQRIQRHSRITLHRATHSKWEQDKTEKSSYGLDWPQKGIWYAPTKLDIRLSQNVQNITWSHKLHQTDHENLESGADSRRKKHSWNKDPKMDFPRRCTIALTIHNSHDATEPHTQKMHCRIQTQQIFLKNEKELETLIHAVRIYSQDIGMEFGIEKCAMFVMKSGKRHMADGMELPNHDKIRTLEGIETNKYLGILEADTIKQVKMEDTIRNKYLRRTRKLLETKLSSRNLIKGINTWAVPLGRYSSGPERNVNKWTEEQEN